LSSYSSKEAGHAEPAAGRPHLALDPTGGSPQIVRRPGRPRAGRARGDPLSGDILVFRNKSADRIKLLLWEEDGYAIWYKRLEKGSYRFPVAADGDAQIEVRAADLIMLLDGVDLASVRRSSRYHRPVPRRTA
jgi:transposase